MLPQGGVDTTCLIVRPFGADPDPADILHPCKFNKFCWKNPAPKGRFQSYAHLRSHQSATIDWDACIAVEPYVDIRDGVTRTLGANALVYADGDEVYLPDAFGERFAVVFVSIEGTPPFHWRKAYLLRQTGEWLMAFNLIVQEQDGAPSVNGVETIQTQQADGLRVTSPAAGTALISQDAFVASGASNKKGCVPAPGASAGTTKYLREDATWKVPTVTPDATEANLLSTYSIVAANGTWVDPFAGSGDLTIDAVGYLLYYSVGARANGAGGSIMARLYDVTGAAVVPFSEIMLLYDNDGTDKRNTSGSVVFFAPVQVSVIRLHVARFGAGAWTTSDILGGATDGHTRFGALQVVQIEAVS